MMSDITDIVRRGYGVIARTYHEHRVAKEEVNERWLESIRHLLPQSGRVVDLGCGSGVPISRYFARRGYDVTGYDLSPAMLTLACKNVPEGQFHEASIQEIELAPDSVDLILSFFAIIHIDRELHAEIFGRMYSWLRTGGAALMTLGADDNPSGAEADWLGAPMAWSHFDSETNLRMLRNAGFDVTWSEVEDFGPGERHLFVIASKP